MGRGGSDTHGAKQAESERAREERWEEGRGLGREGEIAGQTRFPLDGLAAENVPLLGK